ncbi:MAG: TrkA C-terminal domain-containing protein [Bacteroidota bacterium]
MISLISFLIIIVISILITRIAAVALMQTGLSKHSAHFQARSAFTGVGFTTTESESIVSHPVRRKIALILMLLGNAGLVSAMSSLVITFTSDDSNKLDNWLSISIIFASLFGLYLLSRSKLVNRILERIIKWSLKKYAGLEVIDYHMLLDLNGGFEITELTVEEEDWITGKTLKETSLRDEGIIVLDIRRGKESSLGIPEADDMIDVGDILTLYGRKEVLKELDHRKKGVWGDRAHTEASEKMDEYRKKRSEKMKSKN